MSTIAKIPIRLYNESQYSSTTEVQHCHGKFYDCRDIINALRDKDAVTKEEMVEILKLYEQSY